MKVLNFFLVFSLAVVSHSIGNVKRELTAIEKYDISKLRYVAFGTSVTYGSCVDRDTEAYIKVASNGKGKNLGIRTSDPSFPSICTQSMLGDDIYDVIVIEYDRAYQMGLNPLVKRLRERFMDATIIVINSWTFLNVNVIDDNKEEVSLRNFLGLNGFRKNTAEAKEFINGCNATFSFDKEKMEKKDAYMNELVRDYNVKLVNWKWSLGNIKPLLARYLQYFGDDIVHWSPSGHRFVAIHVNKIVEQEKKIVSNNVRSWGEGDVCDKWLGEGTMKKNAVTNGEMVKFDGRYGGKFAVEFSGNRGYINIENPLPSPRELALIYMVTGPAPSIYPKTKISIANSGQDPIIVDPTDTLYDYPVHVQQMVVIGNANPGMNKVTFTPLETTEKPFRLIGYAITNEGRKVMELGPKPLSAARIKVK